MRSLLADAARQKRQAESSGPPAKRQKAEMTPEGLAKAKAKSQAKSSAAKSKAKAKASK